MKYPIFFSLLFFIGSVQSGYAQETDTDKTSFTPPFDFPITFSGNFGEIRANHFHGGLDFKTGGTIGKPVRALADGYISRIRVTHGSGYVLDVAYDNGYSTINRHLSAFVGDVAYDNGYSTINRHLSAFVGDVARRVEDLQYEKESWEVEITPEPDEYPVKAGQIIALSGNTGYSFGPHLHLDMIETATDEYIDPLPFFMDKVKDKTAPRAEGIMLFPQPGKGVVEGKQTRRAFPAHPTKPIIAWGLIGAGIRAYDYMDGVQNKYGVKAVILEVDGEEVFRSTVDRFAYEENRYINSWTHGQYMKSFIEPGNRLRMLQASNGNRGLVDINEERPYRFVYTLRDALGNISKVRFTVQGQKTTIAPVEHREKYALKWDKVNYLQEPGLELVIPKGMLYDNVLLNYSVRADSGDIAFTYQLNDTRIPMHDACDLRIGLRRRPVEDMTKYYVAGVTARGGKYRIGGKYEDGVMKVRIRDLGTYTVAVDTVPPVITPLNQAQWGRTGKIIFKAKDKETGINTYRGTIDGKYALFGKPNSISGNLVCELDPKYVEKGGKHVVEMTVTDGCGNRTTGQFEFVW